MRAGSEGTKPSRLVATSTCTSKQRGRGTGKRASDPERCQALRAMLRSGKTSAKCTSSAGASSSATTLAQ